MAFVGFEDDVLTLAIQPQPVLVDVDQDFAAGVDQLGEEDALKVQTVHPLQPCLAYDFIQDFLLSIIIVPVGLPREEHRQQAVQLRVALE